jgi:lysozyme
MREGLPLVKEFEGCKLVAYQDIVGVWTIGYGETLWLNSSGQRVKVWPGLTITQAQADADVAGRYDEFEAKIKALIKVPVTSNQLGALVSFAYNLGEASLAGSTLLKLLNAGASPATVAVQFPRWNKAGGKVVDGLTRRRNAEAGLFLTK